MQNFAKLLLIFAHFEPNQIAHLAIAILLDDVHAIVIGDEALHIIREWERSKAKIARLDVALAPKLMTRFLEREISGAKGDESDLCPSAHINDRLRNEFARGLVLFRQPVDRRFVVFGTLRVARHRIVARTSCEVRRRIGAGNRAPRNPIVIDIDVASPFAAELLQLLLRQDLSALVRLLWIFERIRHPVVHAQVEIGENEDGSLKHLGEIERLAAEFKTLFDAAGDQRDLLRVTVRQEGDFENIALCGAGRQAGRRSDTLNVPDHAGKLGEVRESGEFGHQRDAGTRRRGHRPRPRPPCT